MEREGSRSLEFMVLYGGGGNRMAIKEHTPQLKRKRSHDWLTTTSEGDP